MKIIKYQKGKSINPFIKQISNAIIGMSMADNPEIMQASGWKQDQNKNYIQKPTKESKQLAKNLAIISSTNPLIDIINLFKPVFYNGIKLSNLLKYKIGQGAETIVIDNTPTKVVKIIYNDYQKVKNHVPNTAKVQKIGVTEESLPVYSQKKLNTSFNWEKTLKKLDKAMQNKGFKIVNDPNVQYRAYRHNNIVIDDISPDNIGITLLGNPKIIDFNFQTVPEWLEQGFKLKLGGVITSFKNC